MEKVTRAVIQQGLRDGVLDAMRQLFHVYFTSTEPQAEARFRTGLIKCLECYDRSCRIVDQVAGQEES